MALRGGELSLSAAGREQAQNDRVLHIDGLPEDPPFQVHIGAIATGAAVQEDPALFERLRRLVRTTLGAEMKGAAIGDVAARFERQAIVVKAVSDHADEEKDDSFRKFVCRASAEVLLAFLLKHFDPAQAPRPLAQRREVEPASAISTRDHNRSILDPMDSLTLVLLAKEISLRASQLCWGSTIHTMTDSATVSVSAGGRSYRATISREASRDRSACDKLLDAIVRVAVFANRSPIATSFALPLELRRQVMEADKAQLAEADCDLRKWVAHFIADRLVVDG